MFTIIDLCFLCLTNNTNLKSVLSKDSDGEIVKEKLKCFLSKHIEIEPEDSMLYICLPCLEKLNDVYNYKRLCLWNINTFNGFIHKLKSTDERYRNVQVTLIDINIKKEICENELDSDSLTIKNSKTNNVTVQKDLNEDETKHRQTPEIVGEIFSKESNEMGYINISENVNKEILIDEIKYESVDEIIVKEETEVNYDIEVKSELYDAFLNGTDNNEESKSKIGPRNENEQYKCNECHKSFKYRSYLITHARIHNGDKPFACNMCDKTFNQKSTLINHELAHSGTKAYRCDVCDKGFTRKGNLVSHKHIHTGDQPYKCDECHQAFITSASLVTHRRIHTGERPFKCDLCDKTFSVKYSLVSHRRRHTGEKPYKCDFCDTAFSARPNLVQHRRVHTGEKPFKCDLCDKAFTASHNLLKHRRSHTGEKPFKCDLCDKAFTTRNNLLKHKCCHTRENVQRM